jgi:pimeloyl-CoA synthetase
MTDFTSEEIKSVVHQCRTVIDRLPVLNNWPQYVAGVVTNKTPKFFLVEYIKENEDDEYTQTYFIEIKEIECDEYLDHINKKLSIKSYHEDKIQSGTDIKENTTGSIGVVENM